MGRENNFDSIFEKKLFVPPAKSGGMEINIIKNYINTDDVTVIF
jgi:hypothetical protein